jgi:hypothetical protein
MYSGRKRHSAVHSQRWHLTWSLLERAGVEPDDCDRQLAGVPVGCDIRLRKRRGGCSAECLKVDDGKRRVTVR